ncbi:MAG: M67 family metallopeptidase [Chloroflexi bacterium]|nr:M67 family metallopeptidase [Chloroflexota bacterium]
MALKLEQTYIDDMIQHARDEFPNECCGVVLGHEGRAVKAYRGVNAEASPYRYNLDPDQLFQIYREAWNNGWDFLVIYHSHVFSAAYPSPTDIGLAFEPEAYYVLVSLEDMDNPVVRAYKIDREARTVSEEQIEMVTE